MKKTGIILLSSACVASCLTLSVAENSLEPGIRVQKIETAEKALAEEDAPFMGAFAEEEPLLKETEETGDNVKNRQSKETKDSETGKTPRSTETPNKTLNSSEETEKKYSPNRDLDKTWFDGKIEEDGKKETHGNEAEINSESTSA